MMRPLAPALAILAAMSPVAAWAQPAKAADDEATALDKAALESHLAGDEAAARKKLGRAISKCGDDRCSKEVAARLHRDLGIVLIVEGDAPDDGAAELEKALATDPAVEMDETFATSAVWKAWVAIVRARKADSAPPPSPPEAPRPSEAPKREAAPAPTTPPARQRSSGFLVGAVVQGDIVFMPGGEPCSRESQSSVTYACFRADREQYLGVPVPGARAPFSASYGTTRIEVHVERAIVNNLTIGGRFGIALGGGPAPAKGPGFLPLHFEARAAYWFGHPPSIDTGLQGFVFLAGGAAQVDASRVVDVQECRAGSTSGCVPADNIQPGSPNPDHQTLRAYKKAGEVFIGAGVGAYYSFIRGSGVALELKAMQLLPSFGTTLSPSLSYVFFVP